MTWGRVHERERTVGENEEAKNCREEESDMSSALPLTTLIYLFSASVRCPRVARYDRVSLGRQTVFCATPGPKRVWGP
jgi:hypothetical protein